MRRLLPVVCAVLALAAACGGQGGAPAGSSSQQRVLTVLAAASLQEVFGVLGKRFEADNPGVTVRFSFGGSSDLAQQVVNGAPADVFASADEATMGTVVKAGLADSQPQIFATNTLEIAVPASNPRSISSLADLAKPATLLVVCAPQVPCGAAYKKVSELAGIALRPVSEEPDVRSVLTKVITGEADAGLVYATDVRSAGAKVKGVAFPEAAKVVNSYPITAVRGAPQAALARRFVDLVRGQVGRQELRNAGFVLP
jgi:molybdate transport system substrate-binding protein